jgi:hypothetical protein
MYPYTSVVTCIRVWQGTVKELKELADKANGQEKKGLPTAIEIYNQCSSDLIHAFLDEVKDVQEMLAEACGDIPEFLPLKQGREGNRGLPNGRA